MSSKTLKKLKNYGYSRSDSPIVEHDNKAYCSKNFKGKFLNHSILEHMPIEKCNFDLAAITGSIYRDCTFINNSFKETDFEFCEFMDCKFWNKDSVNASFNSSNFVNVDFYNILFDSCTFTSAYFENCHFIGSNIRYSTLENAIFKNCVFKDMDLRYLNMDYIELINPTMENVILPMAQIPFMYGCLNYLLETRDSVRISKGNYNSIAPGKYFTEVIPLLKQYFRETDQYFPLANLHLSLKDYQEATDTLKKGVSKSVEDRDFRMLKYYCYLIAKSGFFKPDSLHMFYSNICKLSPQGKSVLAEQRNYARHIGEIKSILFNTTPMPGLKFTVRTNILSHNASELSQILDMLFSISKKDIGYGNNQVEMLISENSPLLIEVRAFGTEKSMTNLLLALLKLTGEKKNISSTISAEDMDSNSIRQLYETVDLYCTKLQELSVSLFLVEYYFENLTGNLFDDKPCYYYNSTLGNKLFGSQSVIGEKTYG